MLQDLQSLTHYFSTPDNGFNWPYVARKTGTFHGYHLSVETAKAKLIKMKSKMEVTGDEGCGDNTPIV